ncbi:MAG: hypothetical protein LZF60_380004 [Nitrospira sp.]|nr:MAG: hypothetical protein LZF60_380004 [Nitrospira sp.]
MRLLMIKVMVFIAVGLGTLSTLGCAELLDSLHRAEDMKARGRCSTPEDCHAILREAKKNLSNISTPVTLWHYDDRLRYQILLGHQRDALHELEQVIDLNYPNYIEPYTRARIEFGKEQWEAPRMYAETWELYASKKEAVVAVGRFKELLDKGFISPGVYLGMYLATCEISSCPTSTEMLDRGVDLNPQSFRLRAARALHLLSGEDVKKADLDIQHVLAVRPQFAEGYMLQASVLVRAGRLREALDLYDKALAMNYKGPDIYLERAYAFAGLERFDDAISALDRAIYLEPTDDKGYAFRGAIYLSQGSPLLAFKDWGVALKINPARYAQKLNEFYTTALTTEPENPELYYRRSEALVALGNFQQAFDDAQKSLSRNNAHAGAYYVRGLCHRALQQDARAITDFQYAVFIDPNLGGAHLQLGLLYSDLFRQSGGKEIGHLKTASEHLIQSDERLAQIDYLRAVLYAGAGTRDYLRKAINFSVSAVQAEPNNTLYTKLLTKLREADSELRDNQLKGLFWGFLGVMAFGALAGGDVPPPVDWTPPANTRPFKPWPGVICTKPGGFCYPTR